MKEEVTKLIETMCSKLGVGVETVWSAMLRQAPLWGCSKIAFVVVLDAILAFVLYLTMRYSKKNKVFHENNQSGVDVIVIFIVAVTSIFMFGATMNFFVNDFSMVLASFFNPEYWAASTLLKLKN